jgi:hypothetical protein
VTVLGDIAGAAGVLVGSGTGDSLGNLLDMLSEALEDISRVWTQWGMECKVSCCWLW